jgi:hypothetical protein
VRARDDDISLKDAPRERANGHLSLKDAPRDRATTTSP